jgi:two-component system sensor histidine kinase KdpD
MVRTRHHLLREERPRPAVGLLLALVTVVAATALVYPLKHLAPVVSLGVVYLLGVLLMSTYGGLRLGVLTSLLSAAAFNWFHIPPVRRWHIAESENWVALAAFVIVAAVASSVADVARSRAREAHQLRREADLSADLARALLAGQDREASLSEAGERIARSVGARAAKIERGLSAAPQEADAIALPLHGGGMQIGRLVISGPSDRETEERLRERVVPPVEAVFWLALQRDAIQAEAVESAALRRSDVLKTALLRTVSHDLRSPLTAIVAAGHALLSPTVERFERELLTRAIVEEGERLSRLIEKLLDLSRLQAGSAEPHRTELALEDLLEVAAERVPADVSLRVDGDPLVEGDGAQLERAFANLLENAARHTGDRPVEVRADVVDGRAVVRITDRGPGIPPAERALIFEPFYRGRDATPGSGSGLGLAIARGFVEANGGGISVESAGERGSTFVVDLPLAADRRVAV